MMSYARARLYLGSSNVGMWVVVSSIFLLFSVPERIFRMSLTPSWADVTQLAAAILVYTAVQGAFDLFGGYFLPKEYGRYTPPLPKFVAHWFRGAALHGALLADGRPQPAGYLAVLRELELHAPRLDDLGHGPLLVEARLERQDASGLIYALALLAEDGRPLLRARGAIALPRVAG